MEKMKGAVKRPVERSRIRVAAGKSIYRSLRYMEWYFGRTKFAKKKNTELMPFVQYKHQTPLLRKLKDMDMWMQYNKITNLKLAVKRLNGLVIYPGETFSYWRTIGKPTGRKGYVEGMILFCGTFSAGIGGGLCQLSNLIYWLTLHTPLTVTERYRHSYDIFPDSNRTQPFGSGATCVYNYRDLRIYNGTNQPYQLHVYVTDDHLVGELRAVQAPIYSYEVYEYKHWITHEYWGGYVRHNIINRKIYNLEKDMINDEYITENHAIMMYSPLLNENR